MMDNTNAEAVESSTGDAGSAGHENPVLESSQDEQASAITADAPLKGPNGGLKQASKVSDENADAPDTMTRLKDTCPTLSDPTTALPAPVLESHTLSTMLDSIEARVAACEKYLGRREDMFSLLTVSDTGVNAKGPLWPTTSGNREGSSENETALPADLEKWQQLLRTSIRPTMPLGSCLESLRRLTDQLVGGKASEVNRKLTELQSWVQAENPSVSRVVLGLETKKAYLLQNEQRIRALAELLKCVDTLKEFVNPPSLTDIVVAEERLSQLEESNAVLAQKAKQLQIDMEEMCLEYNKAMQIVLHILAREPDTQEDKPELLTGDSRARPVVEKPTTTAAD